MDGMINPTLEEKLYQSKLVEQSWGNVGEVKTAFSEDEIQEIVKALQLKEKLQRWRDMEFKEFELLYNDISNEYPQVNQNWLINRIDKLLTE